METSTNQLSDHDAIEALDWELDRGADPNIDSLVRAKAAIMGHDAARNRHKAQVMGAELQTGQDEERYQQVFRRWLRRGMSSLDLDEQRLLIRHKSSWATSEARAPQGVGSGAIGGYLVPKAFAGQVEEALKHFSAVRSIANVMTTETGRNMPWPTVNDTTQVGELLAENAAAAEQDVTFAQVVFTSYKYSSKIVRCSRELVEDAGVDLQAVLTSLFARRIGVLQNTHFTVGTGTGQPQGVVTGATLGKTGTTGVVFDDLVDLVHSVDPLYRSGPSVAFMMHDSTLAAARKVKDTAGQPVVVSATIPGTPPMILGYPVIVNPAMAPLGASAKSILFGDFSRFVIRDSLELAVLRLEQRYAELGQVGFLAFMRSDARMLDAGTAPVKYFQNA